MSLRPNGPRPRRGLVACAWLLAALLAVPGLAMALGLGQIVVKSQPGQPLLAEIPIIAANPAELEDLKVHLASAETFRRVGLQPPDASVTNLQFMVAVDAQGRPVIRVTSPTPPSQPLLTFLLEVDWGEGRLVREYSALLDAPQTVAAPVQAIQAPTVAPANTIERTPPEPEVVAEALPAEPAPVIPSAAPPPSVTPPEPEVAAAPVPAAPVPAAPVPAARVPASAASTGNDYTVRAGDTLSEIASRLGHAGRSLDQAMLALLHANPDAFIGGNVNLVKQGAVLRMPQSDELTRYSAGEAAAMVRAQVAQWREARAPQRQPQEATSTVAASVAAPGRDGSASSAAPMEARLEIVPPSSGSGTAGTRSGTQAGGEGKMLRQEIQETQETLAARDVEVGELKARVAELEKIQNQQQQLIAMKDSALAAARDNLAKANATTQSPIEPSPADAGGGVTLWPWLLAGLVLALIAAWWFLRRRGMAARPRLFDSAAMAASIPKKAPTPAPAPVPAPAPTTPVVATPTPEPEPPAATASQPELQPELLPEPPAQPPHWTAAPAAVGTVPAWRGGPKTPAGFEGGEVLTPARQVELARAYLDLGDDAAAHELLREVLDGRDPVAREIAARMLRELG